MNNVSTVMCMLFGVRYCLLVVIYFHGTLHKNCYNLNLNIQSMVDWDSARLVVYGGESVLGGTKQDLARGCSD